MIGTQTTPTLTPTTIKNITECLAGQENELFHQLEHEHPGGFVPPDIDFSASVFRSSQHSQQQQQHQSLQGQGQENVCNNFLHSASDNDSNQVTDEDDDDESTSFSTGGYSHCPGDSASNDSQETYSTKSSSLRSGNNRTNSSITRSSGNNNNSSSINNKSGSRAKSRTPNRRTRGARNDEKVSLSLQLLQCACEYESMIHYQSELGTTSRKFFTHDVLRDATDSFFFLNF